MVEGIVTRTGNGGHIILTRRRAHSKSRSVNFKRYFE